jgi:hypothetical protein
MLLVKVIRCTYIVGGMRRSIAYIWTLGLYGAISVTGPLSNPSSILRGEMILKSKLMKKLSTAVLATCLVFSMGTSVMAATKTTDTLTTGRTEQIRATGVITPNPVPTLAHYATDVVLTGTVVIDGPKLVLLVGGKDVSLDATLTKVADKTWTYRYNTNVGVQTGNVTFNVDAYTIYANGKPATDIHTRAASSVGQAVHVPFVKSYEYTNLDWTSYDRVSNQFSFSYNLVKVWDDGVREVVAIPVIAQVFGTETYRSSGFEIKPPIVVNSFEVSDGSFTNYNRTNNTYDLSFELTNKLSDGNQENSAVDKIGVDASKDFIYTATSDRLFPFTKDFKFSPPVTVREYTATAGTFTGYNRTDNTVLLTFELKKILSIGEPESKTETATVDAAQTYLFTASDLRAPGFTKDFSFTAPKVFRDFAFSIIAPVWTYIAPTYNVNFVINKTWSDGSADTEVITREGLTQGIANPVSVTIEGVTHDTSLTAPTAPVVLAPTIPSSVQGSVLADSIQSTWTGNNANGGNVQEQYTLNYTINGINSSQTISTNFTSGTGFQSQDLTYTAAYNGQSVQVNYTLPYIQPASTQNNTSNGNGNGNTGNGNK